MMSGVAGSAAEGRHIPCRRVDVENITLLDAEIGQTSTVLEFGNPITRSLGWREGGARRSRWMEGVGWEPSGYNRVRDVERGGEQIWRRASYSKLSPPCIPLLSAWVRVMVGWRRGCQTEGTAGTARLMWQGRSGFPFWEFAVPTHVHVRIWRHNGLIICPGT